MADYIEKPGSGTGAGLQDRTDIKRPRKYKVLLHNDDYTTMDFVVMILRDVFAKQRAEAEKIMLNVHRQGRGIAGIYVHSIAETKMNTVHELAKDFGFPLRCSMEPE